MLISDHYQNYQGPKLIKAVLDNEDITESIKKIYGPNHNWQGYLWTYQELFGKESYGKSFRCDFESDNHQKHWFPAGFLIISHFTVPPRDPSWGCKSSRNRVHVSKN